MSPKPFLLFWASTRAILEFISAREILESIYQTYFHENKTIYKKIDSNEFIKGGFPSLIMAGVVLLSQISLTISNCSYEKFPVNYVRIFAFQCIFASFIMLFFLYFNYLPNGFYFFSVYTFFSGIFSFLEIYIFNGKINRYRAEKTSNKNESLKMPMFKPIFLRLNLVIAAGFGLLLCFTPFQVNGVLNSFYADNGLEILDKNIYCYAVLATVNLSQGFALSLAIVQQRWNYIWGNTEATIFGILLCPLVYTLSDGSFLDIALPTKYALAWGWYGIQMYLMWPRSLSINEN